MRISRSEVQRENFLVVKAKLNKAFRGLRKAGYYAKQNYWCCQTCACADIPQEHAKKYVFYHQQDMDRLKSHAETWLAWAGDGQEIKKILEAAGLKVTWNGKTEQRFTCS